MSRIGKKILIVPNGVKIEIQGQNVIISGPKGSLSVELPIGLELKIQGTEGQLSNVNDASDLNAKFGLFRALLSKMMLGVSVGIKRELEIVGVGYKVQLQGNDLVFALGFSHPVKVSPSEGISFKVEGQTKIVVEGIDAQKVGQVVANIRGIRPPDAYKGKGVRYAGEIVRKKQGKSVKK